MGVGKRLEVVSLRWDKYGGRVDGEIWNERGEELGSWLVEQGLARRTKVGRWKWTGEELVEVEKYAKKLLEGDSL